MDKPLLVAYKNEQDQNHDIHGTPQVVAEINWNQTKFLADAAKRGVHIRMFNYAGQPVPSNKASFDSVWTESNRLRTVDWNGQPRELYYNSVNWHSDSSHPHLDWQNPERPVESFNYWGAEITFYVNIYETGTWRFAAATDDSYEWYVYDGPIPTLLSSYYKGRFITHPPEYNEESQHTFNTTGLFKMVVKITNDNQHWGQYLGYKPPSANANTMNYLPLDPELVIRPDDLESPLANPELVKYNQFDSRVEDWKEWRQYFPLSSVVAPHRPTSGVRYNSLSSDARVMSPTDYIVETRNSPKQNHWYLLSKNNQHYQYWASDCKSSATGDAAGGYALDMSDIIVHYNEPVGTNKISVTMNLGALPHTMTLAYADEDGVWHNIITPGQFIEIDEQTGQIVYYVDRNGVWGVEPDYEQDYSVYVTKIRVNIGAMKTPNARAEVIEISARKELDVTARTAGFNCELSMDEANFMRPLGQISSNSGSIELSNWDGAFGVENLDPVEIGPNRLNQVKERAVKFTFDLLYDLSEQGETDPYRVRMFTMYSANWTREGEFDYTVELFDSAKILQNTVCPEIYERDQPVHIILASILDNVGYTSYRFDREDYSSTSPVLDFFANEPDATVWETIQALCETSMSAVYVDEYDMLQLITKDKLTSAENPAYTLRGEHVIDQEGNTLLPNIVEMNKLYDQEANKVRITYKPKAIKTNKDPNFPQELTDIVWQTNDTITLRATRLVRDLRYAEENEFWIDEGAAELWPFKGRGNINGEMIAWDGKEYYYQRRISPLSQPAVYSYERRICRSQEEVDQCIALSKTGQYKMVNKFTGRIILRRDEKTGTPNGRAIDSSKYRVPHPVNRRPGWFPATHVIGQPGMAPGYWPGEAGTSWYTLSNDANQTSIEINRPTNRNDDWFKNQLLVRSSSPGTVLQQWGARIKFKESTTIGELNFLFNMGQSFGNSEVVTTANPWAFNQYYQVSFLETQNLVRNATHEIGAWVVSPDPVYRTHDNAIRGSASRMYNRNYWEPWEERMKGYKYNFERNKWYDIKIDLTRGRGYYANSDMHFFVWINGQPAGGFNAAGPPNRHKWLARTNYWAIGCRAASKIEIEHAYSWTVFGADNGDGTFTPNYDTEREGTLYDYEQFRWDYANGGYLSTYLEDGILYPAKGKSSPYRDGSQFKGEFFFDDFGGMIHEIRDFEVNLDKAPVETVQTLISNENVRELELTYSPNKAKFAIVNVSNKNVIAHGQEALGGGQQINHSMALYGYVLTEDDEQVVSREDRVAIKDRGEVRLDLTADWINTKEQADELAKWAVKNFAEPKDVITMEVFGDATFSIGDKLNIVYSKAEIEESWLYLVTKIRYTYTDTGLQVNLDLRRARNNYVPSDDGT